MSPQDQDHDVGYSSYKIKVKSLILIK